MCICRECNESRPRTDESFPQAKGGPGGQTAIDPMALGNRQSRRSVLMHICMCVCVYYCMLLYLYTGYFANCVLYMCLYVVYFGNYTCVWICTCVHVYVCMHLYLFMYVCVHVACMNGCAYACINYRDACSEFIHPHIYLIVFLLIHLSFCWLVS